MTLPDPLKLFDPYRRIWVVETPEEKVRQNCLTLLTKELGYPASLIAVEKSLKELIQIARPPLRRADILCFCPSGKPLLLIECKAVNITEAMKRQLKGYNYYLQAPYVALVNKEESLFASQHGPFLPGIKPFAECVACL